MAGTNTDAWMDRYIKEHDLYKSFTSRLCNLVQDLLENLGVEQFHVESRTKGLDRFSELINDSGVSYDDPFKEITDLSGVRIVLYYAEELERVAQMIEEEFRVYPEQSVPYEAIHDPDVYGYRSIRYAVSLPEQRRELREWSRYRDLLAEIQVRTILQNAWVNITTTLPYEQLKQSKSMLKRKLSRMSALLEEADEGFLTLRHLLGGQEPPSGGSTPPPPEEGGGPEEPEPQPEREPEPEPQQPPEEPPALSAEGLETYFAGRPEQLQNWERMARDIGYPVQRYPEEHERQSLKDLVALLDAAGIRTLQDFQRFLEDMEAGGKGRDHLQSIYDSFSDEIADWKVDSYAVLFLMVLNARWQILQDRDLSLLGIKEATDRIKGQ
ncbi:MAG: RelA/SpoT domain-containing protein [Synergistales bacterium]|nr:RelA/SpoT domain-containing protein [Synergistales bacterium]